MPVDPSLVGSATPPQTFTVTAAAIRRFAAAIGDPTPEYRAGTVAPPTFPTTFGFRLGKPPGLDGVAPQRIIHGEQEFAYARPLVAGDQVTCTSRVARVAERETRLGRASFVTLVTDAVDATGALVFQGHSLLIIRQEAQ